VGGFPYAAVYQSHVLRFSAQFVNLVVPEASVTMRSDLSPLHRLYQGKRPSVVAVVTLGVLLVVGASLLVLRTRTSPLTLHVAVMKRRGDKVSVLNVRRNSRVLRSCASRPKPNSASRWRR